MKHFLKIELQNKHFQKQMQHFLEIELQNKHFQKKRYNCQKYSRRNTVLNRRSIIRNGRNTFVNSFVLATCQSKGSKKIEKQLALKMLIKNVRLAFFSSPINHFCFTFPFKERRGLQKHIFCRQNSALCQPAFSLTPRCVSQRSV